ncbi:MAG: hypothetical protein ACOC3T_03875 [Bacteroidota bacterium]
MAEFVRTIVRFNNMAYSYELTAILPFSHISFYHLLALQKSKIIIRYLSFDSTPTLAGFTNAARSSFWQPIFFAPFSFQIHQKSLIIVGRNDN